MADDKQRRGRGCFFYGAITFVLVLIGVTIGLYLGARKAALAAVQKYTSTTAVAVPRLNLSPAEEERIAGELARNAQRAAQTPGGEIVLNEQEINVLLGQSPEIRRFNDQIYLQTEGDKLKAQMSLPLDQFESWKSFIRKVGADDLTNRFLNGTAFLALGVTNGALQARITNVVVNGERMPDQFTKRIADQNFAQNVKENPALQNALQRVRDISVKDGRIVVQFQQ